MLIHRIKINLIRYLITYLITYFLSLLLIVLPSPLSAQERQHTDIINIGSRLELFVDSFLIDKMINTCLLLHEPVDEETVLYFDKPWEGAFCAYVTVIKDGNKYRLYYRAPHIYISVAARFMPHKQVLTEEQAKQLHVNPKYFKDCSDAVFFTSRGGNLYNRTFMEGFIRPGIGLQNWVSRSNYPALNAVQTSPTEISIYLNEDYAQPTAHLHRYSLRVDGFASIRAPFDGGELITKPFFFPGDTLTINFSTSAAGYIKVEIQDMNGIPVEGFALDDAREIIGNEIEKTVTWKNDPDPGKLAGKVIRLHFVMKDADIYSLRFK
ncbi:MAG: hypothetical protein GXO83_03270 [Chlorobi bacterium]|nr:hypothetical protein [Chlorobiota bacterium]